MTLTTRQSEVLEYIKRHLCEYQRMPTCEMIADHFGWASWNAAQTHINALRRKGYLTDELHFKLVGYRVELVEVDN